MGTEPRFRTSPKTFRWLLLPLVLLAACDTTEPNLAPTVEITAPSQNVRAFVGDSIVFTGEAEDPEDGPLTGDAVVWRSDAEGVLANGTSYTFHAEAPGRVSISFHAQDTDIASAHDRRIVEVLPNGAPLIEEVSVAPAPAYTLDSLTLHVSVRDLETGAGETVATWTVAGSGDTLGTGEELRVPAGVLPPGEHRILLTVRDPQGNAVHDSSTVVHAAPDRVRWMHRFRDAVFNVGVTAALDAGPVYIGDYGYPGAGAAEPGYFVRALSTDGDVLWTHEAPAKLWDHSTGLTLTPDGTAYVFDFDGGIYALSASGDELWARDDLLFPDPHGRFGLGPDGELYVAAPMDSASVARLDPADGSTVWQWRHGPDYEYASGPYIDPTGRVVTDVGSRWVMTEPSGSAVRDAEAPSGHFIGAIDDAGTIYVPRPNSLVALDSTLSVLWEAPDLSSADEPVVGGDGSVYVTSEQAAGGTLVTRLAPDGSVVWQQSVDGSTSLSRLALLDDGTLYAVTGRHVHLLSTTDGSVLRSHSFASVVAKGPPVVTSDGTLYLLSEAGILWALDGDSPLASDSPWPVWRGGNRRTASGEVGS